jgi:uncharacterized membrane protein
MLQLPAYPPRAASLILLAVVFVAAGLNHFIMPELYVRMMPAYLPAHLELVYLSGLFEVLGGAAVVLPRLRSVAGWGLVVLLVAVFPANLHMAFRAESFPGLPPLALWGRLPIQGVLIAWAWWATRPDREGEGAQRPAA